MNWITIKTGSSGAGCLRRARSLGSRGVGAKIAITIIAFASTMILGSPAQAYDMDCKVILCLAAGFPSGCGDAHSYMMRRLKKGRGPFGACSRGSGDGGTYDVPVRVFSRKIRPVCTAWVSDRDGRYCSAWIPGRQEGVIGIRIPQDEVLRDYSNEFIWWSRAWDPSDDEK